MHVLKSLEDTDYRSSGCTHRNLHHARSLLDICASVLARDLSAIKHAVTFLPAELYGPLMRACVLGNHLLVTRELLCHWPFRVLDFKHLILPTDNATIDATNRENLKKAFQECGNCVGSVIILTVGELKNKKLKVVDICDFDLDEEVTRVICSTVTAPLIDRDGCDYLLYMAEKAVRLEPLPEPPAEDPVILNVDCVVGEKNVDVVTVAMAIHRVSPISLKCRKLTAGHIGCMKLIALIRSLDPDYCRGVDTSMNSLQCAGLLKILPDLVKVSKLEALGLSYNLLDFRSESGPASQRAANSLADALAQLECLKRLDLSNNRIGGSLRRLLSSLRSPLEGLDVSMCGLREHDLAYLGSGDGGCTRALRELDLSHNNLSRDPELVYGVIKRVECTIEHLSMDGCQLSKIENIGPGLSLACQKCVKLRTLRLIYNRFLEKDCLKIIQQCTVMAMMDNVSISIPADLFDEEGNGIEERRKDFFETVEKHLDSKRPGARHRIVLNLDEEEC